ncbi:MAG: hypothetical protein H7287_11385 [Thermoleophilia bacterium]|nr:hypothetical protein [Thermoleophilia bacterium]
MDVRFERHALEVGQLFRSINDSIAAPYDEPSYADHVTVLCECALVECVDEIEIPLKTFRDLHLNASWFAIRPEHVTMLESDVVAREAEYWVVANPVLALGPDEPVDPPQTFDQLLVDSLRLAVAHRRAAKARADAVSRELELLRTQTDRARRSAERYDAALSDYERLMRHRIANPLTVISGVATTLRDGPRVDLQQQQQLLDALMEQARVLEQVALEPFPLVPSEFGVQPWPYSPGKSA